MNMSVTTLDFLVLCFGASTELADKVQSSILDQGDNTCKEFKLSKNSIAQIVGVTGSLLATLSATTLFSPMLAEIHWIVSAIFAMSLTLSVFSVLAAFNVAFALSSIIDAEGIKLFFSGLSQKTKDNLDSQRRVDKKGLRLILFWVDLPRFFLNLSILDYLIGLGLLQVFFWKGPYNSGPGGLNDRGSGLYILIFFLITVAASTGLIILPRVTKVLNESVIVNEISSRR